MNASLAPAFSEDSTSVLRFQGQCTALHTSSKGRIKSLTLQLTDTELTLEIPKVLGYSLQQKLQVGASLQVWVRPQKHGFKTLMIFPTQDELPPVLTTWADAVPVLKGLNDRSCTSGLTPNLTPNLMPNLTPGTTPLKLQVCTKGSCRKQGSLALLNGLNQQIQDQGLHHQVQVEPVGCLKLCKKAPNVCIFPSGKRVSPADLKDLCNLRSLHAL